MGVRRSAGSTSHRRHATVGAIAAAVLLLATAVAVVPTMDGGETAPAVRGPTTRVPDDSDAVVGPPATAAPVLGAVLPLDGDEALLRDAARRGWEGSGTAEDPVRITGLEIRPHDQSGLRLKGTRLHVVIENALVDVTGTGEGIHLDDVANLTLTGTHVTGGTTALRVIASHDVHVDNNTFEGARIGVLLQGVHDVTIRDSKLTFNGIGIHADADHDLHGPSHGVQVIGNAVRGNMEPDQENGSTTHGGGIILAGRHHTVVRNMLTGNGHAGIWVLASDTTVSGNRVEEGLGHGILVTDAGAVRITDNTMTEHVAGALSGHRTTSLHVDGNRFVGSMEVALRVRDDHSSVLTDNEIEAVVNGIVAIRSTDLVVRQNVVEEVRQGIDLVDTTNATVADNMIESAVVGGLNLFRAHGVAINGNRIWHNGGHGVHIGDASSNVQLEGNHIRSWSRGITLDGGARDIHIKGGYVHGPGAVGIGILDATNIHVEDPDLLMWDFGIQVHQGQGHRIDGGFIARTVIAVSLGPGAAPVSVSGAKLTLNTVGVHVDQSSGHTVQRTDLVMNTEGLLLVQAHETEIAHNRIRDNRIGLHLVNATNNLVYDNLIVNDRQPADQDFLTQNSAGNRWNVSERTGPNVVGGPRIGGNLWRDYTGPDADGDGLGDVPYWPVPLQSPDEDLILFDVGLALDGPLDMHPLVVEGEPEAGGAPSGPDGEPEGGSGHGPGTGKSPVVDPRLPLASSPSWPARTFTE